MRSLKKTELIIALLLLILLPLAVGLCKVIFFKEGGDYILQAIGELPIVGNFLSSFGEWVNASIQEQPILKDMTMIIKVVDEKALEAGLMATSIFALKKIGKIISSKLGSELLISILSIFAGIAFGMIMSVFVIRDHLTVAVFFIVLLGAADLVLIWGTSKKKDKWKQWLEFAQVGLQMIIAAVTAFWVACSVYYFRLPHPPKGTFSILVMRPMLYLIVFIFLDVVVTLMTEEE